MERNGQMRKRKVLAVTGIRSEFDILRPVLTALQEAGFEVGLVVSGATCPIGMEIPLLWWNKRGLRLWTRSIPSL